MFQFVKEVVQTFKDLAIKQEHKGVAKYGEELSPQYEYNLESQQYEKIDWLEMTEEEMVDGFKYIQMEKHRRESKRQAIEELTAKAVGLLDEVVQYRRISEGAADDIGTVKDLLDKIQEVNQR